MPKRILRVAYAVVGVLASMAAADINNALKAQSFRQQYEDRIDAENKARELRLRQFIEPFTNASICFNFTSYPEGIRGGTTTPIICKMNTGGWLIAHGGVPSGNYWDGQYRGSIYGQNGYYFSQIRQVGREDVAARLAVIDENTFRVQFGTNACGYTPLLECQLSDKQCFSQKGPAGRIRIISKDEIIERFKQ